MESPPLADAFRRVRRSAKAAVAPASPHGAGSHPSVHSVATPVAARTLGAKSVESRPFLGFLWFMEFRPRQPARHA